MTNMTDRQSEYFEWVRVYKNNHGYSPTFREIAQGMGVSLKSAYDCMSAIEKKGMCYWDRRISRSLRIL